MNLHWSARNDQNFDLQMGVQVMAPRLIIDGTLPLRLHARTPFWLGQRRLGLWTLRYQEFTIVQRFTSNSWLVTSMISFDSRRPQVPAVTLAEAQDAAAAYARDNHSAATWRAYESDWTIFSAWCQSVDRPPLPATCTTVALFLAAQAHMGLAP
jgi:hypothetical protein